MDGIDAALWPVLAVGLGLLVTVVAYVRRVGPRLDRAISLASIGVALGLALHLARLNLLQPIVSFGPFFTGLAGAPARPLPSDTKLPAAATLAILAVSLAGAWTERRQSPRSAFTLLATTAGLLFALAIDLPAQAVLWAVLLLAALPAAHAPATVLDTRKPGRSEPLLVLLAVGTPVLWLAAALGPGSIPSRVLLVVVGFVTAGLPPFREWRPVPRGAPLVSDGLLPIACYALVATGLSGGPVAPPLSGLVGALALVASGTRVAELRAHARDGTVAGVGRLISALGFVVLATRPWLESGAAVVGLSAIAAGAILVLQSPRRAEEDEAEVVGAVPIDASTAESGLAARAGPISAVTSHLGSRTIWTWERLARLVDEHDDVALGLLVAAVAVLALSA